MRFSRTFIGLPLAFALAACGSSTEEPSPETKTAQSEADSFAARINGGQSQQAAALSPAAVPQAPAPLPVAPAAIPPQCKSDQMREFLGRSASDATRQEIMAASEGIQEVRFIAPGSDYIKPDPTHPRLNIMIDATGVIRDARCG